MSQVNEARFLVQHKSCECKCGLNESVSNSKQKWSHNKCRCDCKKLDDQKFCKSHYIQNPSTCNCDYNKACKIDEYLDIKN